ncbi:hypothetical protein [Nostoc sp. 'Peltigera membranacea cyanobiont' 210A]|nr:hypothetical protein [Nostoc sp. 'Peltigera membranacea cyanobiont' 210A]
MPVAPLLFGKVNFLRRRIRKTSRREAAYGRGDTEKKDELS